MKIKSIIAILLIVLCGTVMFACDTTSGSSFVETKLGVYDFYYDYMLESETVAKTEANTATVKTSTDKDKITRVTQLVGTVSEEEVAIIASVECCSSTGAIKETYINYLDGTIHVAQKSGEYICEVKGAEYKFNIIKDSSSVYAITYKKGENNEYNCTARVSYDQKVGRLQIDITSYDSEGTPVVSSKNFYLLSGGYTALKANITYGKNNTRVKYEIAIYREIVDYSMKISKTTETNVGIVANDLSLDRFALTKDSDVGAYIVKSLNGETSTEVVGNVVNW